MRRHPFSPHTLLLGSVVVMLAATAGNAGAQDRPKVGARVGYNFETDEVMFSTNLIVPVTSQFAFYPSIDVYDPDQGNRLGFNGDMKFAFPVSSGPQFYLGGGVGVLSRTIGDFSSTDVGANLLFGLESRTTWVHPFVEGKVLIQDQTQFMLIGGLNFPIGR